MGEAREMIAMGHARIGAWLMEAWKMPDTLRITLLEHHNKSYRGEHELLVHLVQLGDFLLQYGDEDIPAVGGFPEFSLGLLGLSPEQAGEIYMQVLDGREELVAMSRQFGGSCAV